MTNELDNWFKKQPVEYKIALIKAYLNHPEKVSKTSLNNSLNNFFKSIEIKYKKILFVTYLEVKREEI